MTEVIGFLVHYWLFTTATVACLWVLAVHFLRGSEVGSVGRRLARNEEKRAAEYRATIADEAAELHPNGGESVS